MTLYYFYDALCGWCYGFSPAIKQFCQSHLSDLKIEVISGGMILGNRIGAIGEVAPYIKNAYQDVEKRSGVKFGDKFLKDVLDEGSATFTSLPAAIALSVFKEKLPEHSLSYATKLQKAIYYEGVLPDDYSAYAKKAAEYDFDCKDFEGKMKEKKYLDLANKDFEKAKAFGVNGFPTVVIGEEGKYYLLAKGYMSYQALEQRFAKLLSQI